MGLSMKKIAKPFKWMLKTRTASKKTDNKWDFDPLEIRLCDTDPSQELTKLTTSLQWSTATRKVIVTIQDGNSDEKERYDNFGYAWQQRVTPNVNAPQEYQEKLSLFYAALGGLPLSDLVVQGTMAGSTLVKMVQLRDLNVCLRGGHQHLQALTLSQVILVAETSAEVYELSRCIRGMKQLRLFEIIRCLLVVAGQLGRPGWDIILGACSRLPSLETLHLTSDFPTLAAPSVLFQLMKDSNIDFLEECDPSDHIHSLVGLQVATRPTYLKELSLSCYWNEHNLRALKSLLKRHTKLERLNLSVKALGVHIELADFMQALANNTNLKHLQLHAKVSGRGTRIRCLDSEAWSKLWRENVALQSLDLCPEPPLMIQAKNDLWLNLNKAGRTHSHRLEDQNPEVWAHVLSYRGIGNDLNAIYNLLSSVYPMLIPMK